MKAIVYAGVLGVSVWGAMLSGCAETPEQGVAIEDRGLKAVPTTDAASDKPADKSVAASTQSAAGTQSAADANAVSTQGAPGVAADGKPLPDEAARAHAAASTETVQTSPLPQAAPEVKPLEPAVAADAGQPQATPATGGNADAAAQATQAAIALRLKDPESPLSKRVMLFDYDSAAIRDEYQLLLDAHAEFLKANVSAKAILQGHADERGSREYNLALGQRRAESIYKALNLMGVEAQQIEAVSLGEEKPVSEGHDEAAWQQNRRVEILYQGE